MCVIIAAKVYLKNSKIKKWFLFKNRDRAYPPNYQIHYKNFKGVSTVFVTDSNTDWTEGVNSNGLMIANTALQNYDDKKELGSDKVRSADDLPDYNKGNGKVLRKAFSKKTVKEAVKVIVDNLFDGVTIISDGDNLTVIEVFLKREVDKSLMNTIAKEKGLDIVYDRRELRRELWRRVKKEDFDIATKDITDDDFIVRTNHGELINDAGYLPSDGEGYESSKKRRGYTEKALKKISPVTHPFQILTMMKNLGNEDIDKDPQNRPLRVAPEGYDFDTAEKAVYFTSSIVMLTPTGQLYMIPIDCTFDDYKISRMTKDRDVYFVLLPKNLLLFENRRLFNEEGIIMIEKIKKLLVKERKLMDKYLKKETTVAGDIALPPDKASTDTKAAKKKKKNKKKLLIDEPVINAAKKRGGSG